MISVRIHQVGLLLLLVSTLGIVACGPKNPPAPPPAAASVTPVPTPPAPAPTITLRAEPATIDRGGSITLQWEARNAATVTITPGVGDVPLSGNRAVNPTSSVTYQATATGPGGSASDIARITVNIPAAPAADNSPRKPDVSSTNIATFEQGMKDVLFDYDKAEIRSDMAATLQANANWLKQNPNVRFTIEGHCDERGSEEYNLGLGDRRANAVKEYLASQGIAANRMNTISYGEARPGCSDQSEACFERNRRAHFEQLR
jgi:peptidoglycan-associated lipoprotein